MFCNLVGGRCGGSVTLEARVGGGFGVELQILAFPEEVFLNFEFVLGEKRRR